MSAPHFFAEIGEAGATIELPPADARHATGPLRLRVGDRITVSDGRGGLAVCRIVRADRERVAAEVEETSTERPPSPAVRVLFAAPKGERLSWAVQKLTEVGVDAITTVETDRSVRRWTAERAERAMARMAAVVLEAAKQSRRRFLPDLGGQLGWDEAIDEALGLGPVIVLWEGADEGLSAVLPEAPPPAVTIVIGPEGGIPEEDARRAAAKGALLAGLGSQVLRTETAAVAGAAVVLARYGRLDGPGPGAPG